jgi:predicted RNase H-like HicB family nuclease
MNVVSITANNLRWECREDQATGHLIASCDPLNVVMSGKDPADLEANIRETLQLLFTSLLRDGEFDSFLRQHGWSASPMPSQEDIAAHGLRFNAPMELVAASARGRNDSKRAAH